MKTILALACVIALSPAFLPAETLTPVEAASNEGVSLVTEVKEAAAITAAKTTKTVKTAAASAVSSSASTQSLPAASPKRWPVQILSAIYGTGGKDADVTAAVKEHVEVQKRKFGANPSDLGADPNPGWNKSLHIVYMKDGVRREQRRNENEHILPESFYGPQDAHELRDWLIGTRWAGEEYEMQFNADRTLTGIGLPGKPRWETLAANKLRITWAEDSQQEHVFDYTWGSFHETGKAKNVFHVLR